MANVDQMDVVNITEAAVDLDDPPQVHVIDTTDVENILAWTNAVENLAIHRKLGKSPRMKQSVETVR